MSRFGGLGISSLNSLTGSALPAIQNAINSFLQVSQFQQDQARRKKEQDRAIKEQKKAEKRAFGRSLATMGLSSLAGAAGGAALGSMAGPGVGAATAPAAGAAAGASIAPGEWDFSTIGNIASQAPSYTFGNTLGSSIAKGAMFGALSPVVPGILNAAVDIPYKQANLNLQSERLNLAQREQAAQEKYQQSQIDLGYERLGVDQQEASDLANWRNLSLAQRQMTADEKLALEREKLGALNQYRDQSLGLKRESINNSLMLGADRNRAYDERTDVLKNRPVAGRGPIGETMGIVDTLSRGAYPGYEDILRKRLDTLTSQSTGGRPPTLGEINSYLKTATTAPGLGGLGLDASDPRVQEIRGLIEERMFQSAPQMQQPQDGEERIIGNKRYRWNAMERAFIEVQ